MRVFSFDKVHCGKGLFEEKRGLKKTFKKNQKKLCRNKKGCMFAAAKNESVFRDTF